ncbi:MAG: NUDIX domain-containing protein [Lawsonella sp.]|nr:NUDIX hydrolase [Mycobacteriales bacterium]
MLPVSPTPATSDAPKKWFTQTIDARNERECDILAAGAVVWRKTTEGEIEVLLEHRPNYDDWSLPKGKLDSGESPLLAAVREIYEETGYHVRLGKFLRRIHYPNSRKNVEKVVYFWSAEAVGGEFVPNGEVDKVAWVSVEKALTKTDYSTDVKVLKRFSQIDPTWHPLVLVRHARAGVRENTLEDVLRPLDPIGRQQAGLIADTAKAYGITSIYTADRVRCEQTVIPAARLLNLPLKIARVLSEESYLVHPDDTHVFWHHLCEKSLNGELPLVCSQGGVIPHILSHEVAVSSLELESTKTKKGGTRILFYDDKGILKAVDYLPSPLPVR